VAVACALILTPSQAYATATPGNQIVLTGELPATSTTSLVLAQVEVGSKFGRHNVPGRLTDYPLASTAVTAGTSAFSLTVPRSALLTKAASLNHGIAELLVTVQSGRDATSQYVPLAVTRTGVQLSASFTAELASHSLRLPMFPAMRRLSASRVTATRPNDIVNCIWSTVGSQAERSTRIGELHVADLTGMTEGFDYQNNADTSISVGLSWSTDSGYSQDGSITLTNSIGTDSGFTADRATAEYVQSDIFDQKYENNGGADCPGGLYKIQGVDAVGDSYPETDGYSPAKNPISGGCIDAPAQYGNAKVPTGGYYDSDRGTAETMSYAQNWFGFSFTTTSGFSSDLYDNYHNGTSGMVYVCGYQQVPNVAKILYNNTW
jgi:hypothetical protein